MAAATVRVTDVSFDYPGPTTGTSPVGVLDGLELAVSAGEHVAVAGRSGSGKTTLLSLLGGLEAVQSGTVLVNHVDLGAQTGPGLARHRSREVGFVFQHFGLLEALTARENLELAAALSGASVTDRRQRADELLEAVDLRDRRHHRPRALSGGERQRVAVARALMNQPGLLLADEPTGNLDEDSGRLVADLIAGLPREHGCTVVIATHDPVLIAGADRALHLRRGALHDS